MDKVKRMHPGTCVDPSGKFVWGIHRPVFCAENLRKNDYVETLGALEDGTPIDNGGNFPPGPVDAAKADFVYEIPNPFPFRGVTYINRPWAEEKAENPLSICLPEPPEISFGEWMHAAGIPVSQKLAFLKTLPRPLQLALAETATDMDDLAGLAEISCAFLLEETTRRPLGLRYRKDEKGRVRPVIFDHALYETIANNPHLPDDYKRVMVLRPGVQGASEIVGEWNDIPSGGTTHVFEYLRRNSYIPWGHYAANMSDDAVRYRVNDLTATDMQALRHLYYQRTYVRMAASLGLAEEYRRRGLSEAELEALRLRILEALADPGRRASFRYTRTLWGWNFGFGYASTGYRLHASHQQIHQQYALVPAHMEARDSGNAEAGAGNAADALAAAYACGDQIADFIRRYHAETGQNFFTAYLTAIEGNRRTDGRNAASSLVIYRDPEVLLFVPKAQTSQWEIQIMTLRPVGNVLEANPDTRRSLDQAIRMAVQILEKMGAKMITCIEYSKAFTAPDLDQRLIYAFLPRLPESPGAFSEAQLRWINGHYPEDFAFACRRHIG